MDKYEEFKKFCDDQINGMGGKLLVVGGLFKAFEEEQTQKDKKEKFDDIMCHWLDKSMSNPRMFNLNELFDELKEKDLIK